MCDVSSFSASLIRLRAESAAVDTLCDRSRHRRAPRYTNMQSHRLRRPLRAEK